jgi:replicative DNA helicase Mcm
MVKTLDKLDLTDVGKTVSVKGIILDNQVSHKEALVLPKIINAVFYCKRCGNKYRIPAEENKIIWPKICECLGKTFEQSEEESEFIDYQKIKIKTTNSTPFEVIVELTGKMAGKILVEDLVLVEGVLHSISKSKRRKIRKQYVKVSVEELFIASNKIKKLED